MTRSSLFILVLVLIYSCDSEEKLSGIWIGDYQIHYSSNNPSLSRVRSIMQFEGSTIIIKSLDFEDSADHISGTYRIEGDNLVYKIGHADFDTLKIISLTKDSLVFQMESSYKREVIFRKFSENVSPKSVDIVGKSYSVYSRNFSDSLEFINATKLVHLSEFSYQVEPWTIKDFKGYKFLVIGQFSPAFYIESVSIDSVKLVQLNRKMDRIILSELSRTADASPLIGSWRESSRYGRGPYPSWLTKMELTIDKDSLKIVEGKNSRTKSWKIDATGKWIYFPIQLNSTTIDIWKLIEVANDKLIIERRTLHFQDDKERIELIKQ